MPEGKDLEMAGQGCLEMDVINLGMIIKCKQRLYLEMCVFYKI